MRQPDIEIYIKDADQAAVGAWLEKALGPCSEWRAQGETFRLQEAGGELVAIAVAIDDALQPKLVF